MYRWVEGDVTALSDLEAAIGRRLFQDGLDAVVVLDAEQRIHALNPAAAEMFGYTEAEVRGQPLDWLLPEDTREAHRRHIARFVEQAPTGALRLMSERAPIRGRRRDGSTFPAAATIGVQQHEGYPYPFAILRDISERQAREARLRQQRNLYQALSESNHLLIQTPPPEQLYAEVCRIVVDYGGLVLAWIALVDGDGEVAPVACHGAGDVPAEELGQRLAAAESRTEGVVHMAVRGERRVLIPHLQQDPRMHAHREVAAEWGLGAAGAFPIHRGGTVVGSLNIYAADPAFFAEQEGVVALFDELVADIGAALDDFDRQQRIHALTYRSFVTGLPNRVSLLERLGQEADRLRRQGGHGAVIHADIDDFKAINDSLGTRAGDEVLRLLAARLTASLRIEDVAAHTGADELVVLIPDLPRPSEEAVMEAHRLAEEVRSALQGPLSLGGRSLRVTTSVGVALFPDEDGEGCDPSAGEEGPAATASERLLQQARLALAKAQREGGDRVRFYDPALRRRAERQLDLGEQLRLAQERGELQVVYQPQWELATERVVGLEALLRWHHPERGPISPGEFIPIAERTGQIRELGDWVLEQVLAQADAWLQRSKAPLPLGLAVNVSPLQFNQDDWGQGVLERLSQAGVSGRCLKLEVTESLLMANLNTAQAKMADLRAAGVGFALDDFGTGYSSLAYLQELPLDFLKVDRSFVQRIGETRASEGIIEAVLAMARHLGLRVIAEGVETAEQAAFLQERGCEVGQGFYWAKPLPAAEIEPLLRGKA